MCMKKVTISVRLLQSKWDTKIRDNKGKYLMNRRRGNEDRGGRLNMDYWRFPS